MTQPQLKTQHDIGVEATQRQHMAADPTANVWVGASAGTGKTKILTDRVLRLLLPQEIDGDGVDPEKILCITFTKAGASEMVDRIMRVLSEWAVMDEAKLVAELENLLGQPATRLQMDKARRLFAQVIDLPTGLNIMTIHAFCQSVLKRFPVEASLPPHFQVIEGAELAALQRQACDRLFTQKITGVLDADVATSLDYILQHKNGDQLYQLIAAILSDRHKLQSFFDGAGFAAIRGRVCDALLIEQEKTEESCFMDFFAAFPAFDIMELAEAMAFGTPKNQETAAFLKFFLSVETDKILHYPKYQDVFLTTEEKPRAPSAVTKDADAANPRARSIFVQEGERIVTLLDRLKSIQTRDATLAILRIARAVIDIYNGLKAAQNALDYDDLIHITAQLLGADGGMRDWVMFKLDGGIDHVLLDEAQDTSPDQWSIILGLVDDFYAGESARNDGKTRTLFVVGDVKQSIFSFQGADPRAYSTMKTHLEAKVTQSRNVWQAIPMTTSFRSTQTVLNAVDQVFAAPNLHHSLTLAAEDYHPHTAWRVGQAGRVEIWPPYKSPDPGKRAAWALPDTVLPPSFQATYALANRIADQIAEWIKNGDILPSKKRSIQAGDIMILLRQRNALVEHLIRALKARQVPVSGADRMVVTDQIAVQDVLAVLSFSLLPSDDLTLAVVLKSPFIGWNDAQIEAYAYGRTGTLWQAVQKDGPADLVQWLRGLVDTIPGQTAYETVQGILSQPCPNNGLSGWEALITRLGYDSADPVQEFLSMAMDYDAQNSGGSVQSFVTATQADKKQIKREFDSGDNIVRIMTVHASKGLQAPIVILPDTTSLPKSGGRDEGFLWADTDHDACPLWSPSASAQPQVMTGINEKQYQDDLTESNRLLYVAMTRAEDRLIVCGTLNRKQKDVPEGCWYDLVSQGFSDLPAQHKEGQPWPYEPDFMIVDNPMAHIYDLGDDISPVENEDKKQQDKEATTVIPQWIHQSMAELESTSSPLRPSRPADQDLPTRSPLYYADQSYRFERGNLTHKLLQYLPDVSPQARAERSAAYIGMHGTSLPPEVQKGIIDETMAVLSHPDFQMFFQPGSMAEVPLSGQITTDQGKTHTVSGQVDRLLVTDTDVWIVDFKSNRPPPTDPAKVPHEYRMQLSYYKKLLSQVYPGRQIHCALLWTDGPYIMEMKDL